MINLTEKVLNKLPTFVDIKDKYGKYIFCNEHVAEGLGLDSPQQIIGKTDYDLCWKKYAGLYIASDNKVMHGESFINQLEPQCQTQGEIKVLITKTSLLNPENEPIGIICSYINVSDYFLYKKNSTFKFKDNKCYLGKYFSNEYLTRSELDILKGIIYGHTAKKIAHSLTISPRTAECHINNIKQKLQCKTKGDIITESIKTGLIYEILDL